MNHPFYRDKNKRRTTLFTDYEQWRYLVLLLIL